MNRNAFTENVVIITGASSGIGQQLAYNLAEQGAWLVLSARNVDNLQEVANTCAHLGAKVVIIPTDVSDKSQCRNLIEKTIEHYGRIDTLINNAGFAVASRFVDMSDLTVFEKIIQVNFFGGVYCTHYALPYLIKSGGRLIAISSLRGRLPSGTADGYGASKHAMAEFYSSLRNELSDTGVSVTLIYPSWVKTGITGRALKADGTFKGEVSVHEKNGMSPEKCASIIVNAAGKRKGEIVMTFEGKLGLWLRLIAPSLVDKILRKKTEQ
ncbi:MAG TPA: SDR family oxidoreductase [Bacteroidales bacterium]|nr:SDR family oxidoreductase [Bacteroidales bacterium]